MTLYIWGRPERYGSYRRAAERAGGRVCFGGNPERCGTLLLPVMGRDTLPEPEGRYWKMNRTWALVSRDGGRTWPEAVFVSGGNDLCSIESAMAVTGRGDVVSIMRASYGTSPTMYQNWSRDGGMTWTAAVPCGLPNTTAGTKPFLLRLQSGNYLLLQTDEHATSHRVNMTAFLTDEEGLYQNRWKWKRVVCTDCKSAWQGSQYASAAQSADGAIHIALCAFTGQSNRLYALKVTEQWLMEGVYEPAGGRHEMENDLPALCGEAMVFTSTRSRAQAGLFGTLNTENAFLRMTVEVAQYPEEYNFALLSLRSRNGSETEFELAVRGGKLYAVSSEGERELCGGSRFDICVRITGGNTYRCTINGTDCGSFYGAGFNRPDTLMTGGRYDRPEGCRIAVTALSYGDGGDME